MLGSTNKHDQSLIILKPISKLKTGESVKPFFQISKKNGQAWEISEDQSISEVTGNLTKLEVVEDEYEGQKYFRVKTFLKDGSETYLIPFRLNIATRGLLNSLFNLDSFDNVSISYYRSKSDYEVFSVSQNGKRVSWKFELSQLPEPEEISLRGKKLRDYTLLDNFYIEQIKILSEKLSVTKSVTDKPSLEESVTEEVPF